MDINELYILSKGGKKADEECLFDALGARFKYFAQQKIRDAQDSEEIVQEALTTIAVKYRDLEVEKSFAAWAHRVLQNKILEYYRSRGRREQKMAEYSASGAERVMNGPDESLQSQLLECLRKLAAVNRRYARILNFSYQGYAVVDICNRLGMTRTNLYTVLSRARSSLEICLEKVALE